MQPVMNVENVWRIPGRGVLVFGKLFGSAISVGQFILLRLGDIERPAKVVELSTGFNRPPPPQRVLPGYNVALLLRGDGLDVIQDGDPWQVFAEAEGVEP